VASSRSSKVICLTSKAHTIAPTTFAHPRVFSIIFQPISKVFRLSTHISSRVFFLPSFEMRTRCHFCRLPLATSRLLLFFFFSPLTGVFAREDVIENFAAKRRLAAV
jgi:hypothetical protein